MTKYSRVDVRWRSNFAYGIGLITSDGSLQNKRKRIFFSSKDLELMRLFKKSLGIRNRICLYARGGEIDKKYFCVTFTDANFYNFLNSIGLHFNKSKTIKSVEVPDKFFADFLRGLFDGDGSFYLFKDKRWQNSFGFRMSFASASKTFLVWLKTSLTRLYQVKGFIKIGKGVFILEYVKGDTRKLFKHMYYSSKTLYFSRKYAKINSTILNDNKVGTLYLQIPQRPE